MNPFDYSKAVADFWTAQGQTLLKAQEQAGKALAEGMKVAALGKFPMVPAMPAGLSTAATDLANASKSVMELWSAATSICGKLASTIPTPSGGDGIVEATFRKMVDPRGWVGGTGEMDDVLGHMAEGPRFADLWEAERRYAGVLQAWMNVRRRSLEHNAVVLEAWLQAGRRFTEHLAGQTGPDAKTLDAKAALTLWTETANRQLLETQRSDAFLQTQAAMIRATTELRMAQQDLVEHFGKQYGFPTRTELDDVHRTVTDLRRELRAMRREPRQPDPVVPPVSSGRPTVFVNKQTASANARHTSPSPNKRVSSSSQRVTLSSKQATPASDLHAASSKSVSTPNGRAALPIERAVSLNNHAAAADEVSASAELLRVQRSSRRAGVKQGVMRK